MKSKSNELKIVRIYDASLKQVWEAWTDPKKAVHWWGPRGFSLTTHSKELRPGGMWHYTMHGPDGQDYINKTIYHEVEDQRKLVYDHGGNDEQAPLFRVRVLFSEMNHQTTMDMTMILPTVEAAEEIRKFIVAAGGNSTWDRLAEYLAHEKSGREIFVIHHVFETDRETLFDWWAKPEKRSQWLSPLDVQVPPADEHRPQRLVYVQQRPQVLRTTVDFVAEQPNLTRVRVVSEGPTLAPECINLKQLRLEMAQSWTRDFHQLASLL